MSIYGNLFTYRPTPGRAPLEDFLSEALADLLNRLPAQEHVRFIADLLLGEAGRAEWLDVVAQLPAPTLRWATQVRIGDGKGIIDMLLRLNGKPAIIVENKVGAPIRPHEAPGDDGDAGEVRPASLSSGNQMRTYGLWLAAQIRLGEWPGAVVLLTHRSAAPQDYGSSGYGVPFATVCKWRRVWSWAREIGQPTNADGAPFTPWTGLANELSQFLEVRGMSADYMTRTDVARAQVFVAASDRITQTFAAVQESLQRLRSELGTGRFHSVTYNSEAAVAWAWFYLREPRSWNWSLAWGLRFPESSNWWTDCQPPLPDTPHVFVSLGYENERYAVPASSEASQLPTGWLLVSESELVSARALTEFPVEGEAFAAEFGMWVAAAIEALKPTLERLVSRAASDGRS